MVKKETKVKAKRVAAAAGMMMMMMMVGGSLTHSLTHSVSKSVGKCQSSSAIVVQLLSALQIISRSRRLESVDCAHRLTPPLKSNPIKSKLGIHSALPTHTLSLMQTELKC